MTRSRRLDLVTLWAPGSIEAVVAGVQARLFAEHGLASSQALPPFIPVCFLAPDQTAPGLLARVARSARTSLAFRATRMQWESGWLYLMLDTAGAWQSARTEAGGDAASPLTAPLPFPCVEGFFLGCGEASEEEREHIGLAAPELRFTSCSVALVRLDCLEDPSGWWRQLSWEILEERPLRVRRQV